MVHGKQPPYTFSGNLIEFFDILSEILGVCYEIVIPQVGNYGHLLSNGTWTGLIGMMNRSEADLCSQAAITPETYEALDYSEFLYGDDVVLAFKRPELEPDLTGFVKPYTGLMWALMFISALVVFLAMCIVYDQHSRLVATR
ncbi:glutamate receptor ionotropic, delta-1-like [Penaeus indicus]|uniref:glutamate receptor ionotropic, delta-1-like n=1 Tax=Penaeus indicus TaxID=29960 RepID=UPI00300CFECC